MIRRTVLKTGAGDGSMVSACSSSRGPGFGS